MLNFDGPVNNHFYLYFKNEYYDNFFTTFSKKTFKCCGKILVHNSVFNRPCWFSQTLTSEFQTAGYTLSDLGSIEQLPSRYGGLTIRPDQPNTLYIGGYANEGQGNLYTVPLVRDAVTNHITGFGGSATLYSAAPNNDGGIFFAPNGALLFTR
jgi:hypothetical protein